MSDSAVPAPTIARRFIRSTVLLMVVVIVVSVAWALIGYWRTASTPPTPVTLAVSKGPFSATIRIAEQRGYFSDEGLEVTIEVFDSGRQALASLDGQGLRLATAADTGVGSAIASGEPLSVVGLVASIIDLVVVAYRVDHGITSPSDLVGRRVGLMPGSTSEYFFDVMLDLHGIQPASVTIIPMPIDALSSALLAGEIDAAVLWSPYYDRVREQGPGIIGIFGNEGLYHWSFLLTARHDDQPSREVADRVLRALIRAGADIATQPEASAAFVAPWLDIDKQRILGLWSWCSFDVHLGRSVLLQLENAVNWAQAKQGQEPGENTIDVLDHIDPIPLHRVDPIRVRLIHPLIP